MNSTVVKIGAEQCTKEIPSFRIGDTVCVHVKIKEGAKERIQNYTGVVIARNGIDRRFQGRQERLDLAERGVGCIVGQITRHDDEVKDFADTCQIARDRLGDGINVFPRRRAGGGTAAEVEVG